MQRKISADDESRMVGAVEKAAMLVSCKDNCDTNKTLANCLLEKNVDSRFAKMASAAFNRRLTVLNFQKADDAHRGDTFGLSDADSVFELMGGEPEGQKKVAALSVMGAFKMELVVPETQVKQASEPPRPRYVKYEERVNVPNFEKHIESIMDKQAALYMNMMGDLKKVEDNINSRKNEMAWELVKVAEESPFAYQTICNIFGDRLEKAIGDRMPLNYTMQKTAAAIDPGTPLTKKIAKFLDDVDSYVAYNDMMCDYKDWLGGFAKAAADASKEMHKVAFSPSAFAGNIARTGAGLGMTGVQALNEIREATGEAMGSAISNINNLYKAVGPEGMSPSDILTADFVSNDRMHDRMMAIADIMADPYIAQYPAEQQFAAANKIMDLHPALEGAGAREALKMEVADLLLRNNRQGKADIASTATILANLGKASPSASEKALAMASALDKVQGPETPDISDTSALLSPKSKIGDRDVTSRVLQENDKERERAKNKEDKETDAKSKHETEANRHREEQEKEYNRKIEAENENTRRTRAQEAQEEHQKQMRSITDTHNKAQEASARENAFWNAVRAANWKYDDRFTPGTPQFYQLPPVRVTGTGKHKTTTQPPPNVFYSDKKDLDRHVFHIGI